MNYMTLENITGNLSEAYKQCVPSTMLCVDQLMTARRTNKELRTQWFYTADGEVYSVDNGTPTLRITRESTNPVFNHLEDDVNSSYEQLVQTGNYQVLLADFDAVKAAADTVTINLTKLTLQGNDKKGCYLAISTTKYDQLNSQERVLAERVYGQGTDFTENMKILSDASINETRIHVLNPEYVKTNAKNNPVGRASWLSSFGSSSYFGAGGRYIDNNFRVRGVRREGERSEPMRPQGDAAKNEAVPPVAEAPLEVKSPLLEDILSLVRPYVAEKLLPELEQQLGNLYKQ